jgi:glycosyltransferase involved in cell wall biosynthesis
VGRLSLIVSTYEWPEALEVVLLALSEQSDRDFEVVVADDGSGPATAAVTERWQATFGDRLQHVRHADEGFRLARIRDLGALAARGDHLVFLDGDCVPRTRLVEAIRRAALPGWFLASKRVNLGPELSRQMLEARLPAWRWSAATWLVRGRGESDLRLGHLTHGRRPWRHWLPELYEFHAAYGGYGFSLGVSRADFEEVNGFDTRFVGWGGEDEDLAVRLRRLGLRCRWPGPGSTLLHLWHAPRLDGARPNSPLLRETERSGRIEAAQGLRELASQTRT